MLIQHFWEESICVNIVFQIQYIICYGEIDPKKTDINPCLKIYTWIHTALGSHFQLISTEVEECKKFTFRNPPKLKHQRTNRIRAILNKLNFIHMLPLSDSSLSLSYSVLLITSRIYKSTHGYDQLRQMPGIIIPLRWEQC